MIFHNNCYSVRESDYGNEEVAEYLKEEKKRKQMEALAEDLFKYEVVCNFVPSILHVLPGGFAENIVYFVN